MQKNGDCVRSVNVDIAKKVEKKPLLSAALGRRLRGKPNRKEKKNMENRF